MKKKIVIHTILILLITMVFILGYPFAYCYPNLPVRSFVFCVPEWGFFFIVMVLICIISFFFQYIGKKRNIRLLKHTSIILFSIFLMFITVFFVTEHLQEKPWYYEMRAEYVNKAKEDIESDKVKLDYFAMLGPWIKEGKKNTVDSISNKYGVQLIGYDDSSLSCHKKAKEKYDELVDAYLIERNGEDWKQRMNAELEPYINRLHRED